VKKILAILCGLLCLTAFAAEVIPPVPAKYFNDYAGVVSAGTAAQLNQRLEQFERDASSQILVAVYPKMQSDSSVDDYCVRVFNSWHVGQKGKNNGAVLFVFVQDHKMFLQTGYGLEGALPDVTCKRIIEDEIAPRFKAQDFDGGLTAGVNAILAATKGEYHGTGQTVADRGANHQSGPGGLAFVIIIIFVVLFILARSRGGGGGLLSTAGWMLASSGGSRWSSGRSGGGWSGGGFSGGGGGGFSSGGGSSGGGGAGGSW
jgi:uncharacterized protein